MAASSVAGLCEAVRAGWPRNGVTDLSFTHIFGSLSPAPIKQGFRGPRPRGDARRDRPIDRGISSPQRPKSLGFGCPLVARRIPPEMWVKDRSQTPATEEAISPLADYPGVRCEGEPP